MKDVGLFILSFIIGAAGLFGYVKLQTKNLPEKPIEKKQIPAPAFTIEIPPSDSLKGSIATRSGTIKFESRTATEPAELTENLSIEQGERLVTGNKSSISVDFDRFGSFKLSENTDLLFIQTLPVNLTVEQKKGTVDYSLTGTTPLSIRLRSALITKESGNIKIAVTDKNPIILISTVKGTARIGFNDTDLISRVFTLKEGQVYEYNSDERTAVNSKNK